MKKGLIFFLGIITGCVLTIAALFVIGVGYSNSAESNITIAERQTEFKEANSLRFFRYWRWSLANCEEQGYSSSYFTGPVVYILSDGQNLFYDDQVIDIPYGKKAIQIGTYRYQTKLGRKGLFQLLNFNRYK